MNFKANPDNIQEKKCFTMRSVLTGDAELPLFREFPSDYFDYIPLPVAVLGKLFVFLFEIFLIPVMLVYRLLRFLARKSYVLIRWTYRFAIIRSNISILSRDRRFAQNVKKSIMGVPAQLHRWRTVLLRYIWPPIYFANLFLYLHRFNAAAHLFLRSSAISVPTVAQYYGAALALLFAERYSQAMATASKALRQYPRSHELSRILAHAAAALNREMDAMRVLTETGTSYGVALAAVLMVRAKHYEKAVRLLSVHVETHPGDGEAAGDYLLLRLNRRKEALAAYDAALTICPTNALLLKRAMALPLHVSTEADIYQIRHEIEANLSCLADNPPSPDASTFSDTFPKMWTGSRPMDLLYSILYHGESDLSLMKVRCRAYRAIFPDLCASPASIHAKCASPARRMRVGFYTELTHASQILAFWGPVIERLPRDMFEVFLFLPEGIEWPDAARLAQLADKTVFCPYPWKAPMIPVARAYGEAAFEETRRRIIDAELDLFYNPFIGQDVMAQYLSFFRLAPVQVVDGGRLTTTGMPETDYFVMHEASFVGDPDVWFSEKLALISGNTPVLVESLRFPPSIEKLKRADFGLPENATIYLSTQDISRRHPEMDRIFSRLLQRDPKSLLYVSDYGMPGVFFEFKENLRKSGVAHVNTRIQPAPILWDRPKSFFYAFIGLADANLAYRRMSGGTTFFDHLAAGVPFLVWPFEGLIGTSARIYEQMGLLDLMADSEEDYVEKAYLLAHDRKWKKQLCHQIKVCRPEYVRLCQNEDGMLDLAQFFAQAIARARSGLPPAHWRAGVFHDKLTPEQLNEFSRITD